VTHRDPQSDSSAASAEAPLVGKGGAEHKYLQHVIKRLSIERDFGRRSRAPSDGQVDVALHREGLSIACEVSVTTGIEHELGNVRKCWTRGSPRYG